MAEDHSGTPGAGIPAERCGVWPDDHEQRGAVCCCRCGGSGEEAGRSAQPAGEATDLQRAERPQERAVPPAPELSLQRVGETAGMGFRLPRLCVSNPFLKPDVSLFSLMVTAPYFHVLRLNLKCDFFVFKKKLASVFGALRARTDTRTQSPSSPE